MNNDTIETLVDLLYEMDARLCYDLGFAGGFQIPDDEEDRQDIADDLEEAIAHVKRRETK
jgi:type VI protein secretion system component VasF